MRAPTRLSPLDASFLEVETPAAHMHVGWVAVLDPPETGRRPGFEELRDHLTARLPRAPRYLQRLRTVPFGLSAPVWVDDLSFDPNRHLIEARSRRLEEVVDTCMSVPISRSRPLWQMHLAPRLEDGRIGLVCKAHHCMVDGIAAVQLGSMLLDSDHTATEPQAPEWRPEPGPSEIELLLAGVGDLVRSQLAFGSLPARIATSPRRAMEAAGRGRRALGAVTDSLRPAPQIRSLNRPISPRRHVAHLVRPLDELRQIKATLGVKMNDVVLAAAASGLRRFLADRGERPGRVKAMVPVNVRADDPESLGNRISFMFIELPCQEPDAIRRLRDIHLSTDRCKQAGTPEGGDDVLGLLGLAPPPVRRAVSRFVSSPRAFNLVVSNIPGPPEETYVRGCRVREAYPIVPLADRHTLSIGFTSIADRGCFGLYADREALPDADHLAACIDASIDELGRLGRPATPRVPAFG